MIDSHVHLNHPDFSDDLDQVLERARSAGVTGMVNIGFDLASSRETAGMLDRYEFMYGAVGVHPHDASTYDDSVESSIEELLTRDRIVAVGEVGLDFFRDLSPRDEQSRAFRRQIALAKRHRKPIIIHCRDAFDETIAVLREESDRYDGIFHAFTGDGAMARRVLDLGFHIGIGGVVTFKNARLGPVVAELPTESIVLETDCPYLTPAPYRGKRNEPAYLTYIVDKIAAVRGTTVEAVIEATNRNFARAMGLAS